MTHRVLSMTLAIYTTMCMHNVFGQTADHNRNQSSNPKSTVDPLHATIVGFYVRRPVKNAWHMGRIVRNEQDGFNWENDAGIVWKLTPDLINSRLKKRPGTNNYNRPDGKALTLLVENGVVQGFSHVQDRYVRMKASLAAMAMLELDEVRRHLKITKSNESAYAKMRDESLAFAEAQQKRISELFENDPEAGDQVEKLADEVHAAIQERDIEFDIQADQLITREQAARLEQIALQFVGIHASLRSPYIKRALAITPDQVARLDAVGDSLTEKIVQLYSDDSESDLTSRKHMLQEAAARESLEILTKQQRMKLNNLRGDPFEFHEDAGNEP